MAKSLSSLWLKSARRLGKVQQAQGSKLFKSLLKTAVKSAKPAKKTTSKSTTAKPKAASTPGPVKATKATKSAKPQFINSLANAPGSWRKAIFSEPADGTLAAPRRLLYWLYIPASAAAATPAKPLPLVVMLHGCRQSATDFATSTRMNTLAERKGFAVLYPQQSAAHDVNRCWPWYKPQAWQGQGDVALLAAMIEKVQASHGFDLTRTYVSGLSAGAGLAALLALRYPALMAAVGLHSGPVFGVADSSLSAYRVMQTGSSAANAAALEVISTQTSLALRSGMPVMLIHGDRDAVVRRINLPQQAQQFALVNITVIDSAAPLRQSHPSREGRKPRYGWQTLTTYAGRKPQIVSCEVAGLGHAWSGGDASVPFSDAQGPDASALLWAFFARHKRAAMSPDSP